MNRGTLHKSLLPQNMPEDCGAGRAPRQAMSDPLHAARFPLHPDGSGLVWEKTPLIMPPLSCAEWVRLFGDSNMTPALWARLTHPCDLLETGNDSCRFHHRKNPLSQSNGLQRCKPENSERKRVEIFAR